MASRQELANAIRALSMDAIQKANSGHPGAPMGMAEIGEVLWNNHMSHNPTNPEWANRDRFILSNGHGSMLIYSLLHLTGYDLPMSEIQSFRQLHSKCAGHPEYGYAPGVETTTGPLGQGISNAVGFAMAEKLLANQFNKLGHDIVDHYTYVFMGDGCLMEGISHETCALAGTWGLGKLIAFWDDNGISIDGHIEGWYTDDTAGRFESYGWHVVRDVDGHDFDAIDKAIQEAKSVSDKPTLICCKTIIGKGSPNKSNSPEAHGGTLGEEEVALTRKELGWEHDPFLIPQDIYDGWNQKDKGQERESAWNTKFAAYEKEFPELASEFKRRINGNLPKNWEKISKLIIDESINDIHFIEPRNYSQKIIHKLSNFFPEFLGGSADVTSCVMTTCDNFTHVNGKTPGNYISYGAREFGMAAIMNGLSLHGGFIPFGGTFNVFSDYMRNAIRMSALMNRKVIYLLSHDSISVAEDGPTHQSIEGTVSLRIIPNINVWRPGNSIETSISWISAINYNNPTAIILNIENCKNVEVSKSQIKDIFKGGYILKKEEKELELIIIATGSELEIAEQAQSELSKINIGVRLVSMPCTNIYDRQSEDYKKTVIPENIKCISVEAGITNFWKIYTGRKGINIGIDRFGESAPYEELKKFFGINKENIINKALKILNRH